MNFVRWLKCCALPVCLFLWPCSVLATSAYAPPFSLRVTNSNYLRVTNNAATTKRVRCIAQITAGPGIGGITSVDLSLAAGATGDCRPGSGVEWLIQSVVHEPGSISLGHYDGANLIAFDIDPATGINNRYVPTFPLRVSNSNYLRVTNTEATTKRVRCIGTINRGAGGGGIFSADFNVAAGATADCRPTTGIEWIIQAVLHEGAIDLGYYDGSNLIDFDSDPAFGGGLKKYPCEVLFGAPDATSPLADTSDAPQSRGNVTGVDAIIIAVACYADAGTPQINPVLADGTAILSSPFNCGAGAWNAGAVVGTPTIHSFGVDGASCPLAPCNLNANISSAGGTAKYLVMRFTLLDQ